MKINEESLRNFFYTIFSQKSGYALAIAGCAIWLLFFDSFSIVDLIRYNSKVSGLEREIAEHREVSRISAEKLKELKDNPESLEKYAREQFGMKRDNEDVFIVK